jgi:DNA-binding YbaB/EbfC family protein
MRRKRPRARRKDDFREGFLAMKDISQIMRQAQQMQAKINEAQKKLEAMEVEGSAGGGMVKLRITGKNALLSIAIDPSLMVADEREILEDLIKAAHDDARRKLEDAQNEEMKDLSGGLGILPGFKMPF